MLRFHALRNPEQAEESHHVIDPQPAGVAYARADRLDERLVSGLAEPARYERWKSPVLPSGVELVGRGADADALREHVLERPAVRAVGVEPDRQILHHGHGARGGGELPVYLELHPLVETDAIRHRTHVRHVAHRGGRRLAELVRPTVPAGLEPLGERAEDGEFLEAGPVFRREGVELRKVAPPDDLPDPFEDTHLEPEDLVAVDPPLLVERPGASGCRGQIRQRLRAVDLLDPQVQRVAEPAARRKVRAGLLGHDGYDGRQRVDERDACSAPGRPAPHPAEIRQIADAPAAPRAGGIQLDGPSPGAQRLRKETRGRCDDEPRDGPVRPRDLVIAGRSPGGSRWSIVSVVPSSRRTSARPTVARIAFGHDEDRRSVAGRLADRAADGRDGLGRRHPAPAEGVDVVGLNLGGGGAHCGAILFRSTSDHAWTCMRPPASSSGPRSSSDM